MTMFESANVPSLARNLAVYTVGVALSVAGALGLAGAVELSLIVSGALFVAGLAAVLVVHEYMGGPF